MNSMWGAMALVTCLLLIALAMNATAIVGDKRDLQYIPKGPLITGGELDFYRLLSRLVAERAANRWVLFAKVCLGDLVEAAPGEGRQRRRNRISQKHVDFVICDINSLKPVVLIELDDRSHEREDRKYGDRWKDDICEAAGLLLIRFRRRSAYNASEVWDEVKQQITRAKQK